MSITIELAGRRATIADGKWRSADDVVQELLNNQLATLTLPSHHPLADLERAAADSAVEQFGARIIGLNSTPADPARNSDDELVIY